MLSSVKRYRAIHINEQFTKMYQNKLPADTWTSCTDDYFLRNK